MLKLFGLWLLSVFTVGNVTMIPGGALGLLLAGWWWPRPEDWLLGAVFAVGLALFVHTLIMWWVVRHWPDQPRD